MEAYKRGSHTVWDCKYHLVWVTKYRYQFWAVMSGSGAESCCGRRHGRTRWSFMRGRLIATTCTCCCRSHRSLSVSRAVQYLKGRSSHKLLSEFGALRKRYWGQHLWARGYWVASSGNVTDEVWTDYIKNQAPPEPDDDFNVT